jgi:nucleotide-binding universal stress UspA family protein
MLLCCVDCCFYHTRTRHSYSTRLKANHSPSPGPLIITARQLDYFDQSDEASVLAAQQPALDARFTSRLRAAGLTCPVTVHIVQASEDARTLARVVCRHAEREKADLVIMGRGPPRSRLQALFVGSAGAYVEKDCKAARVRLVSQEEAAPYAPHHQQQQQSGADDASGAGAS